MNSTALVDFNLFSFYHSTKLPNLSTNSLSEKHHLGKFSSELRGTAKHILKKKKKIPQINLDFWDLETQNETCSHPTVERLIRKVMTRPGLLIVKMETWE